MQQVKLKFSAFTGGLLVATLLFQVHTLQRMNLAIRRADDRLPGICQYDGIEPGSVEALEVIGMNGVAYPPHL